MVLLLVAPFEALSSSGRRGELVMGREPQRLTGNTLARRQSFIPRPGWRQRTDTTNLTRKLFCFVPVAFAYMFGHVPGSPVSGTFNSKRKSCISTNHSSGILKKFTFHIRNSQLPVQPRRHFPTLSVPLEFGANPKPPDAKVTKQLPAGHTQRNVY